MRDKEQLEMSRWKVVHAENAPGARTPPGIKHVFLLLQCSYGTWRRRDFFCFSGMVYSNISAVLLVS